jgi:mycothiol S-conjugate amidase
MTSSSPLRLLTVHAHPDDEASKGASLVAAYRAQGIPATLVCCTGGEQGEVLNPAMDKPEIVEHLHEVRMAELEASVAIIGYEHLDLLGYLDSGMPDSEANADPLNFANAPLDEAVEKLVRIIRRDKPQVIITYSDDQGGYLHPDHLKVHEISVPAFDRAGDTAWYPDSGEPWTPLKLYYTVWSRARIVAVHEKMLELGIESPYNEDWFNRPNQDERITTRVFIGDHFGVRGAALRAHATQVDPTSPFWFGLSDEMQADLYPWDEYVLAQSRVESTLPEDDLFAGVPGR